LGTPSCWVSHESKGEEDGSERLERSADGEYGAADASATTDGEESEEVGDDHQEESEDEAEDGAPPRVRVLLLVQLGEHLLQGTPVRNALALEELLPGRNGAVEKQADVVLQQFFGRTVVHCVLDSSEDVSHRVLDSFEGIDI